MTTVATISTDTTKWLPLKPSLNGGAAQRYFVSFASQLEDLNEEDGGTAASRMRLLRTRAMADARADVGADCQPTRLIVSLLCDLAAQGWRVRVDGENVFLSPPQLHNERDADKERVRRALALARDEQLSEPSVRAFVQGMESRRLGPMGWCSILSLVRDGEELASRLSEIQDHHELNGVMPDNWNDVVQPYLQFVTEDARCPWTGLRLGDVWRYFRYTWLTPSRSTPGRSMMILLRDASIEPHPVVGIAALSSSIVQQSFRDGWIKWDRDSLWDEIDNRPSTELASWLWESLTQVLDGIAHHDFVAEGVLSEDDLKQPSQPVLERLERLGAEEKLKHQNSVRNLDYKQLQDCDNWLSLVNSHLYRFKRASTLADLLNIRAVFASTGFTEPDIAHLETARSQGAFRRAAARLLRYIKATHVGINMMDISVAGAIAPYNEILGGKLMSLLLASPEVTRAYAERYKKAPSVIASAMKGAPVFRRPNLVLLGTTGLFSGGSSQYNRIRMPADEVGGSRGEIRFLQLPQTTSYSTFHFSQATLGEMKLFIEQHHNGSNVNGIFGEGVNPKMRKIRETLYKLSIPDNELLQAGSPRALYMIPLAHNFREVLTGRVTAPDYILPQEKPEEVTQEMVTFWKKRWLHDRVLRPAVRDQVARHTLTYPLLHGAVVHLPRLEDEDQMAFDDLFLEDDDA